MAMTRLPRHTSSLRWLKLAAAVLLALWFMTKAIPGRAQEATDAPPPIDSALQIEELKEQLAADPYDAEGHTKLAILYAQEDLLEEARASFVMALQAAPTEPGSHVNLGLILLRMKLWDDAVTALTTYAMMTNVQARGHVLLGQAYEGKGDLAKAREVWITASETPNMALSEKAILREHAANTHIDDEELIDALNVLEGDTVLLESTDGTTLREMATYAHLELAKTAREAGEVDEALTRYASARELGTDNSSAYADPVELLLEQGDLARASALAQETEAAMPGKAVAEFVIGRVAEENGDLRTAAARYRTASKLDPETPGIFAKLGSVLGQLGDDAGAQTALAQAVKRGEGGAAAAFNMGVVLSNDGKFSEAIPHLQSAVAADPGMKDAHRALGIAFRKTKQYTPAAKTYQAIVDQFGPDPSDLYQLAYAQAKSNQHQDAVSNYQMVVALQPEHFFAHYNLGNSFMSLNQHQSAADAFKQALAGSPPDRNAHERAQYNLALCYQKLELFEEAISEYKAALDLKETYRSLVNLAICYAAIEDTELSDEYYARAAELKKGR